MRPGSPCRELALFAELLWATERGKWGSHSFLSRCQTRRGWNSWWGSDTQPRPRPVANLELCLLATIATILVQGKTLVWCPSLCMAWSWMVLDLEPRPSWSWFSGLVGIVSRYIEYPDFYHRPENRSWPGAPEDSKAQAYRINIDPEAQVCTDSERAQGGGSRPVLQV